MNSLLSINSYSIVGGKVIKPLLKYYPTSNSDYTASTGQTMTFNGPSLALAQISGKWSAQTSTTSNSNYISFSLGASFPSTFTMCCFIYVSIPTSNSDWMQCVNSSNSIILNIRARSVNATLSAIGVFNSSQTIIGASSAFSTNIWYHFAMTYDGTTFKCFLNGIQQTTSTVSNFNNGISTIYLMGSAVSGSTNGAGTDFRIYDLALTQSQISAIYNGTF